MVKIISKYNDVIYQIKYNIFQRYYMRFIEKIKYKEILSMNGTYYYFPKENLLLQFEDGKLIVIDKKHYESKVNERIEQLKVDLEQAQLINEELVAQHKSSIDKLNKDIHYLLDEVTKNGKDRRKNS